MTKTKEQRREELFLEYVKNYKKINIEEIIQKEKLTYKAKIQKIGNSFYIIIPSYIRKSMKINKDSFIEVSISLLIDVISSKVSRDSLETQGEVFNQNIIKTYICKRDNNVFDSGDENPYCNICGQEEVREIEKSDLELNEEATY